MKQLRSRPASTLAVLLDTDFAYGARVLSGVQSVARRGERWRLLPLHSAQDSLLGSLLAERRVDGAIGAFVSDRWARELAEVAHGAPLVNVGAMSEIRSVPSVVPDDVAVGRLAARHLLGRGWTQLAAVHDPASHAECARLEGFREVAGDGVRTPPRGRGYAVDATWDAWIAGLARPFAVFCTGDFLARQFLRRLDALGLHVPEDGAVMGVGDSVLHSVLAGVALSSVTLPAERVGALAAERLGALLRGEPEDGGMVLVAPEGVAARESTSRSPSFGPLVGRALAVMDEHLGDPPGMGALASACGASRRLLELRFREELGQSPAAVLRERRTALACRLLRDTDLSLGRVADAAGFTDPPRFWGFFRRHVGCTPGEYRARQRA